jgi:hypothetical protein
LFTFKWNSSGPLTSEVYKYNVCENKTDVLGMLIYWYVFSIIFTGR